MSGSDEGHNGRNSPAEMTFEHQLALEGVHSTTAAVINAAWNVANINPDVSPTESDIWVHEGRRHDRAAARLNAQDRQRNRSNSDPIPSPRLRAPPGRRGSTSEIPDALAYTSLTEPEMAPSHQLPFSRRANAERDRVAEEERAFHEDIQAAEEEAAEDREQLQLSCTRNEREDAFLVHRDSPERQRLLEELESRVEEFAASDPEAHNEWNQHFEESVLATSSEARQYQMLLWYIRGPEGSIHDASRRVPSRLLRQITRVERYYTTLARLERDFGRAERDESAFYRAGMEEEPRARVPTTDNDWVGMPDYEPVGFESSETGIGFENYSPRHSPTTEAELLLAHVRANFLTRRIRLLHATSAAEFAILLARMHSFIPQALLTFEHLEFADVSRVPADFEQRDAQERSLFTDFQEDGMEYDGPTGNASEYDEESDASEIEDFPNGMPTAVENARRMEEDAGVADPEA